MHTSAQNGSLSLSLCNVHLVYTTLIEKAGCVTVEATSLFYLQLLYTSHIDKANSLTEWRLHLSSIYRVSQRMDASSLSMCSFQTLSQRIEISSSCSATTQVLYAILHYMEVDLSAMYNLYVQFI